MEYSNYSPKEVLEIRGAATYMFVITIMDVLASVAQYVGGSSIAMIMPTTMGYGVCIFLAYIILKRKRQKKTVIGYQWVVAVISTLFAVYARYNYVKNYDWQYAALGIHVAAITLISIVSLQYFYNKRLYLFFLVIYCFNYITFFLLLFTVGHVPVIISGHLNGQIFHGINALTQIYFFVISAIVAFLAYRNIPIVEELDALSIEQRTRIEQQSTLQYTLVSEVKDNMSELFPEIEKQNEISSEFRLKMQEQAASFEQISATLEELFASSENISGTATKQVFENGKMEEMISDLRRIEGTTKAKLEEVLSQIHIVVNESARGEEKLSVVESTIDDIKKQSSSIGDMISIITDIADKINLLSLNASIEAARAGDQGRGFAVVADEIGKLAAQTSDSIKQIESMLAESTKTTASGVEVIKDTSDIVKAMIASMVTSSGKIAELNEAIVNEETCIEKIYDQMKRNVEIATNTEVGTSEQMFALRTTVSVIEHLNTILAELVNGIEQLARSSSMIEAHARVLLDKTEKENV